MPFPSKRIIALLQSNGWTHVRTKGSHHVFKHPDRPNTIAVPHPKKDIPIGTLRSILKAAGLSEKDQ